MGGFRALCGRLNTILKWMDWTYVGSVHVNQMKWNSIQFWRLIIHFWVIHFNKIIQIKTKWLERELDREEWGRLLLDRVWERENTSGWDREKERMREGREREMVYAVGIDQQSTLTIKPPKEDFPLLLPTSLNGFITRQIHCNSKISTFIDKSTHTHIVRKASQIGIICDKCYCLPRNDDINVVCVREYS